MTDYESFTIAWLVMGGVMDLACVALVIYTIVVRRASDKIVMGFFEAVGAKRLEKGKKGGILLNG